MFVSGNQFNIKIHYGFANFLIDRLKFHQNLTL